MRWLGELWPVSSLTLGGGGLGQLCGTASRDEAVATMREPGSTCSMSRPATETPRPSASSATRSAAGCRQARIVEQQPHASRSESDDEERFEHALRAHERHLPKRRPGSSRARPA